MTTQQRKSPKFSLKIKRRTIVHPDIEHLIDDEIVKFVSNKLYTEVMSKFGGFNVENTEEITQIAIGISEKYLSSAYDVEVVENKD